MSEVPLYFSPITRGEVYLFLGGGMHLNHGVRCIGHRVVEHPKLLDWRHVLRN